MVVVKYGPSGGIGRTELGESGGGVSRELGKVVGRGCRVQKKSVPLCAVWEKRQAGEEGQAKAGLSPMPLRGKRNERNNGRGFNRFFMFSETERVGDILNRNRTALDA